MKEGFTNFIVATIVMLIAAFFVMLLWNLNVPAVFGLRTVTYDQALGLMLLGNFLFNTKPGSKPE